MRKLKLTQVRRKRFLEALADTGSVTKAAVVAGTSRTRVYELRKVDPAFAAAWAEAEDIAVDQLEDEARRRAVEGVPEPLVSAGKLVRDDNGQPMVWAGSSGYVPDLRLGSAVAAPSARASERTLSWACQKLSTSPPSASAKSSAAPIVRTQLPRLPSATRMTQTPPLLLRRV